ncbi:ATP-binding protein [Nonomuraea sp. NPDC050404]|uniref:ATP-binding protein n=1 Tax=Nonomuraea sp. NPDC050404 TaxID=3155783 RepID=UPI0034078A57
MGQHVGGFWLPGIAASVTVARHCARVVLRVSVGDAIDDVLLVLTELVGNAVKHTRSGWPGGQVRVEFELDRSNSLWVRVIDQGSMQVPFPRTPTAAMKENGPIKESGRGLHLVESLAKEWGVCWPRQGCVVWALMDVPSSEEQVREISGAGIDQAGIRAGSGSGGHVAGADGMDPAASLYEGLCAAARHRQSDGRRS